MFAEAFGTTNRIHDLDQNVVVDSTDFWFFINLFGATY